MLTSTSETSPRVITLKPFMRYLTPENKDRVIHIVEKYINEDFTRMLSKKLDNEHKISTVINVNQESFNGKITIDIKYEVV
jgi:hypothetical protein